MKKIIISSAVAIAALGACGLAQAQSAGTWLLRAGAMTIKPDVTSGDLSAPAPTNTKIDVESDTQLAGGISYMLTDNWSLDLPLATPFKHKIKGDGAIAGSGEIATTKSLPATLFLQYRFLQAQSTFRPYVGAGLTYAHFYDETANGTLTGMTNPGGTPTTMSIKDKLGATFQVGLTYAVTSRVFLEGMVGKTFVKTQSTLSTGQTIDTKLDPVIAGVYVGYRF